MAAPYSYVIHIRDDMNRLYFDEEAQAFMEKPGQVQVQDLPPRKKRCWEPPVFFSLPDFFLQPTKKVKNA
jgi:hypothetical protein